MPFTDETLEFMVRNKLTDSREWFHEHREEYEKLVVEPLAELVTELAPAMAEIDPAIMCIPKVGKSISRIWRDTRRGPELPIFRDVMWIILLRSKQQNLPGYWFEFSPRALRWGCGWYQTNPAIMAEMRSLILADDRLWKGALRAYRKQDAFTLENERYKRSKYPDAAPEKREWLDLKSACLTHDEPGLELLFSDELAPRLAEDFRSIAPVYELFLESTLRARLPERAR